MKHSVQRSPNSRDRDSIHLTMVQKNLFELNTDRPTFIGILSDEVTPAKVFWRLNVKNSRLGRALYKVFYKEIINK